MGYGIYRAEIKRIWVTKTPPPPNGADLFCTDFVRAHKYPFGANASLIREQRTSAFYHVLKTSLR